MNDPQMAESLEHVSEPGVRYRIDHLGQRARAAGQGVEPLVHRRRRSSPSKPKRTASASEASSWLAYVHLHKAGTGSLRAGRQGSCILRCGMTLIRDKTTFLARLLHPGDETPGPPYAELQS